MRIIFIGSAKKTSDNNSFKQAGTNLNNEYSKSDAKATVYNVSSGTEIINKINNSKKQIKSVDFISHSGADGLYFDHSEWWGDNDFYVNSKTEEANAGYSNNDSADLSEINYNKFTNDAKVEFHGCNSGNKDFSENMASEFSKNMYNAGKTKSVAIGKGTYANPNSPAPARFPSRGSIKFNYNSNKKFRKVRRHFRSLDQTL